MPRRPFCSVPYVRGRELTYFSQSNFDVYGKNLNDSVEEQHLFHVGECRAVFGLVANSRDTQIHPQARGWKYRGQP